MKRCGPRPPHLLRPRPAPVQTLEQGLELRSRQPDATVANRWLGKPALLKPLVRQHQTRAVEPQHLDAVGALGYEYICHPRIRVRAQLVVKFRRIRQIVLTFSGSSQAKKGYLPAKYSVSVGYNVGQHFL